MYLLFRMVIVATAFKSLVLHILSSLTLKDHDMIANCLAQYLIHLFQIRSLKYFASLMFSECNKFNLCL